MVGECDAIGIVKTDLNLTRTEDERLEMKQ